MTSLDYIEIEGLRSFRKKARIQFPRRGLTLLKGHNLDTGGSSGSGKSTIGIAINLALGTNDIPATELKSWGGKAPAGVVLGLTGSKTAVIGRGKKFDLSVAGVDVDGSAEQKEEAIVKVFGGLDPQMIHALTYRGQRKPGLFLSKADAAKKDFLTKVLKLEPIENELEKRAKTIVELERQHLAADLEGTNFEQQLESLAPEVNVDEVRALVEQMRERIVGRQAAIERITNTYKANKTGLDELIASMNESVRPIIDDNEARIRLLRAEKVSFSADTTKLDGLNKLVDQCKLRQGLLEAEDAKRRYTLEQQRAAINKTLQACGAKAGAISGLVRERDRLRRELDTMVVDVCPTCERDWDRAHDRRAQLTKDLAQAVAKVEDCAQYVGEVDRLQDQLRALPKFEANPMIVKIAEMLAAKTGEAAAEKQRLAGERVVAEAERRRVVAEAEGELASFKANHEGGIKELRAGVDRDLQELQVMAEEERRALAKDQLGFSELQVQLARIEERAAQAARASALLAKANEKVAALDAQLRAERDYVHMIGREGFLGSIFDEVLQQISDETNKILGAVANTRHVTLQFRSENLTKKGTIEREIKPIITINGYEVPKSGLSGGMLSTVELAVDLAVGAVVSEREGVCPGWLILDESFDGLDAVSKDSCLEILERYAHDRLVLVVDHMSETQGRFSQVINVEYENGESRIAA